MRLSSIDLAISYREITISIGLTSGTILTINPDVAKQMPDRIARTSPAHSMTRILCYILVMASSGSAGREEIAIGTVTKFGILFLLRVVVDSHGSIRSDVCLIIVAHHRS